MGRWGNLAAAVALVGVGVGVVGCSGDDDDAEPGAKAEEPEPEQAPTDTATLKAELLEMFDADQAERSGASSGHDDKGRADRLAEIVDEVGWPTIDLVGQEAATAAWTIAQHADHDLEFQKQALALMEQALVEDQVDSTEVAYLVDRVATNEGRPQVYGTQGGCVDGKAEIGPLEDEANVEARRAEAGLQPLAQYLAEFTAVCAEDVSP